MLFRILRDINNKLPYQLRRRPKPNSIPAALTAHLTSHSNGRQITLIDVGAHEGEFTRIIDHFYGITKGLLVEVQPKKAEALSLEFKQPRFDVANFAAYHKEATKEISINSYDPTTSLLKTKRTLPELAGIDVTAREVITCKCSKLDSLAPRTKFPSVDLLKIDVQGTEHLVIEGAAETLERTSAIWIEVSFVQLYDDSALFSDIHSSLRTKGFMLRELNPAFRSPNGELLQADALFSR